MGRKPKALLKLIERANVVSSTTINNKLGFFLFFLFAPFRPSDSMFFLFIYLFIQFVRTVFHLFSFLFPKIVLSLSLSLLPSDSMFLFACFLLVFSMYCICSGFPCYSLRGILYLCFHKENEKKKRTVLGLSGEEYFC